MRNEFDFMDIFYQKGNCLNIKMLFFCKNNCMSTAGVREPYYAPRGKESTL